MKRLLLVLFLLLTPTLSFSAPAITSVSDTTPTNGQSITIGGTDFGTHDLDVEWIGDNIEATTAGTTPSIAGWNFTTDIDPTVVTTQAHSGTKSIYAFVPGSAGGGGTAASIRYDSGAAIPAGTTYYVTWWVRFTVGISPTNHQWKMLRVSWENDIVDDYGECVMFNWVGDNPNQFFMRPGPSSSGTNVNALYPSAYPSAFNTWYRMEFEHHTSNEGVADGSWTITRHLGGSGIISNSDSGTTYWDGVTRRHRWFLFQNYIGNGGGNLEYWMDDFYVQAGTAARVELGDASTWATCTQREIQIPTAWSTTSATITFNTGNLTGTKYLYVVKSDGTYNSTGYAVTIDGSSSSDTTAPTAGSYNPAKSATDVPIDTNISAVISDSGDGVNVDTIQMSVEGANHCCSQMVGTCPSSGTKDLTCTGGVAAVTITKGSNTFTNSQTVDVILNASDLAGNAMAADSYSFTTTASGADTTDPVVTITNPTTATYYYTADSATTFSGTASDNVALATPAVAWVNSQGGSGNAAGSTAWSVDVLPLTASTYGANLITNGDFPSDYTSWAVNNAIATQGEYGSRVNVVSIADDGAWSELYQTITVENGALYLVTARVYSVGTDLDENGAILIDNAATRTNTLGNAQVMGITAANTWTNVAGLVLASGTSMTIRLHSEEQYTAYFDDVVVKKVTGANVITVTATDTSANTATDQLTIVYDAPAAPDPAPVRVIVQDANGRTWVYDAAGVHLVTE